MSTTFAADTLAPKETDATEAAAISRTVPLPVPFKNVVFSGGGMKFFAYLGVIRRLRLQNISGIGGTSAGALFAVLCALTKFDDACISNIMYNFDYAGLSQFLNADMLVTMIKTAGILHLDDVIDFFGLFLEPVFGSVEDVTMKLLWEKTGYYIRIGASDILRQVPFVFDHINTPNVRLIDALWSSMCIPYAMQPIHMKIDGQPYMFVDGGFTSNLPGHMFPSDNLLCVTLYKLHEPLNEPLAKDHPLYNGFDENEPLFEQHMSLLRAIVFTPINFSHRAIGITHQDAFVLSARYDDVPFYKFTISQTEKMNMEVRGYECADAFVMVQYMLWSLAWLVISVGRIRAGRYACDP